MKPCFVSQSLFELETLEQVFQAVEPSTANVKESGDRASGGRLPPQPLTAAAAHRRRRRRLFVV